MTDDGIRKTARERLDRRQFSPPGDLDPADLHQVVEELRIHQIELEMQNDQLQLVNERLVAARDWYFALFTESPLPSLLVDDRLIITEGNLAAAELFGKDRGQLAGMPVMTLVSTAGQVPAMRHFLDAANGRQTRTLRGLELSHPDRVIEVDVHVCRLATEQGTVLLVTLVDLTEQRAVERKLRDAQQRAEQASASKTQFLANISHELRSPLASIMGYLDLVIAGVRADDHPKMLRIVRNTSEHLLATVSDLLDLSRTEANRLDLRPDITSLRELGEQVHQLFVEQAARKGLELGLELVDPLPTWVIADGFRVRQILINLVSNAVKYTEIGSVHLEVAYRHSNAVFTVRDTGIGIPQEMIDRVFQPFEQVDASDRRSVKGVGLGLTLCKRLTEAMNGAIFVSTKPGEGSKFTVQLPLRTIDNPVVADEESVVTMTATERAATVLIVDDDEDLAELFSICLEEAGHTTHKVNRAKEGLEELASGKYDICLLDMQMPEMDGFEMLHRLRENPDTRNLPVLAVTAAASQDDRERCLAAGASGYLAKPFNVAKLSRVVADFLLPAE